MGAHRAVPSVSWQVRPTFTCLTQGTSAWYRRSGRPCWTCTAFTWGKLLWGLPPGMCRPHSSTQVL